MYNYMYFKRTLLRGGGGGWVPSESCSRKLPKTVLGSTRVVEQLSFSMFPSILTFDFDLILG